MIRIEEVCFQLTVEKLTYGLRVDIRQGRAEWGRFTLSFSFSMSCRSCSASRSLRAGNRD